MKFLEGESFPAQHQDNVQMCEWMFNHKYSSEFCEIAKKRKKKN